MGAMVHEIANSCGIKKKKSCGRDSHLRLFSFLPYSFCYSLLARKVELWMKFNDEKNGITF